jgi:uncharacterized protein
VPTLMRLGSVSFEMHDLNMQKFDRNIAFRWDGQQRIGRRPAMQFMGTGEETVEIQGTIYPHYFSGVNAYENMRAQASDGKPYPLATGTGRNLGQFVIKALKDGNSYLLSNGAPRKIEFTVSLSNYGEDDALGGLLSGLASFISPFMTTIASSLHGSIPGGLAGLSNYTNYIAGIGGIGGIGGLISGVAGGSGIGGISGLISGVAGGGGYSGWLHQPSLADMGIAQSFSSMATSFGSSFSSIEGLTRNINIAGVIETAGSIAKVAGAAIRTVEQGRRLVDAIRTENISGMTRGVSAIAGSTGQALINLGGDYQSIQTAANLMNAANATATVGQIVSYGSNIRRNIQYLRSNGSDSVGGILDGAYYRTARNVVGSVDAAADTAVNMPVISV